MHNHQVMRLLVALFLVVTGTLGTLGYAETIDKTEATAMTLYTSPVPTGWQWYRKTPLPDCWFGVIESAAELQQLLAKHPFLEPRVPAVDWQSEVLIIAALGEAPTGGYAAKIVQIAVAGQEIRVQMYLRSPGPTDLTTQVITYPADVVRLQRLQLPTRPNRFVFTNQQQQVVANFTLL